MATQGGGLSSWGRESAGGPRAPGARQAVLDVRGLTVEFAGEQGPVRAVREVSFELFAGETVAIVGESGSGKTATMEAIMGLTDERAGTVRAARVRFGDRDLLELSPRHRRAFCGRHLGMIFQDPLSVLNPGFSVGWQVGEMLRVRDGLSRRAAKSRVLDLLERVNLPRPDDLYGAYPHQLSGGMRQRIVIAMALAPEPEILIADEPTTALDVSVQADVLDLLRELRDDLGMSVVFITHDLGVAAEMGDRINVMYAGRIVESGTATNVLSRPAHPYTADLLRSLPRADLGVQELLPIAGEAPDLTRLPSGCSFRTRCRLAHGRCRRERPRLAAVDGPSGPRVAACHVSGDVWAEGAHLGENPT